MSPGFSSTRTPSSAETRRTGPADRTVTDFDGNVTRLEFHPDPILRRNPANRPRRRAVHRAAGVAAAQPQP
ncbi:hypothetical protein DY000_02030453 [Brassica cretica]|uniref:Uncharacterized protein n=1 Tax=Brassica cretica TaxID=69181 RepID=A0ABQ7DLW1_BRACR|nr:hypothetical protein DY000_02030453 [Brassica cretica]